MSDSKLITEIQSLKHALLNPLKAMEAKLDAQTQGMHDLATVLSAGKTGAPASNQSILFGNMTGFIKNLTDLASGMGDLEKGLRKFGRSEHDGRVFTRFLRNMSNAITRDGKYEKPKEIADMYDAFGRGFGSVSRNITPLSIGLMFMKVAESGGASEMFKDAMDNIFHEDLIDKVKHKNVINLGRSLNDMGRAMFTLGRAGILAGPMLMLGDKMGSYDRFADISRKLFSPEFVSYFDNKVALKAGMALNDMGRAMFTLGAAGVIAGPMLMLADKMGSYDIYERVARRLLSANYAEGVDMKRLKQADSALRDMGRTMLFMGAIGLVAGPLLVAAAIPLGLGLLVIKGVFEMMKWIGESVSRSVEKASGAMRHTGISILVISGALALSSLALSNVGWDNLGMMAAVIGGVALMVGVIGAIPTMDRGVKSLGFIGLGLISIGIGLATIMEFNYFNEGNKWENYGFLMATLVGLGGVFGVAGIPVIAGAIGLGALAFAAIGGSLMIVGAGLKSIMNAANTFGGIKDFDGDAFTGMMAALGTGIMAFLQPNILEGVDEDAGLGARIWGKVKNVAGGVGNAAAIMAAAKVMLPAGKGLSDLANGVNSFRNDIGGLDDVAELSDMINHSVLAVGSAFTGFAASGRGSLMDGDREVNYKSALRGVKFVKNIGNALSSISKGLKTWSTGFNFTDDPDDPDSISGIANKAAAVVGVVGAKFAEFAGEGRRDLTVPAYVDGKRVPGKDRTVDFRSALRGVRFVKSIGDALSSTGEGLKTWSTEFNFTADSEDPDSITNIANKAAAVVGVVALKFMDFAGESRRYLEFTDPETKERVKVHHKSATRGVKFVGEIGNALMSTSEGLKNWSSDMSDVDAAAISKKIASVVGITAGTFSAVAKYADAGKDGIGYIKDAMKAVGTVDERMKSFAGMDDPRQTANDINWSMRMMLQAFSHDKKWDNKSMHSFLGVLTKFENKRIPDNIGEIANGTVMISDAINEISDMKMDALTKFVDKLMEVETQAMENFKENVEAITEVVGELDEPSKGLGERLRDGFRGDKTREDSEPAVVGMERVEALLTQLIQQQHNLNNTMSSVVDALSGTITVKNETYV